MKNLLLGLVFGILLASVPQAYTQQEQERIYIGATTSLQLCMEKDAVISKLAERGYTLTKVQNTENSLTENWMVREKNDQAHEYDSLGYLTFKDGHLASASRVWADNWDAGSARVGRNLYFLVKSFEESGNTACSLEAKPQEGLEFDSKASLIHCGRRTITVDANKYRDQREETQVVETVR
jgi:hypothetical protein